MKITNVDPHKLIPHDKNPRIHPEEAIEKLMQSIKVYGWTNPIIATQDGIILAGHARQKAALRLKLKTVPVITVPITGDQAEAYLVADNRVQEETFWDEAELRSLMADLARQIAENPEDDLSIDITGFSFEEAEVMGKLYELDKELRDDAGRAGADQAAMDSSLHICPRCGQENR